MTIISSQTNTVKAAVEGRGDGVAGGGKTTIQEDGIKAGSDAER